MTRYTRLGHLHYQQPYDWNWMFNFLRKRGVAHIEAVSESSFSRTLCIDDHEGWIRIQPEPGRVAVSAGGSLFEVAQSVLDCVSRMFDLAADPAAIATHLATLDGANPGIRLPGSPNVFEFAVRAILEQQISTAAAMRLTAKFVAQFGREIETDTPGMDRLFPEPQELAANTPEALASIGLPRTRAQALHTLASRVASGELGLDPPQDIEQGIKALTRLPGIGPWTAGYIAMRGWSAPDVFLPTDHAICMRYPGKRPGEILAASNAWRPYRSYAVLGIWESTERAGN